MPFYRCKIQYDGSSYSGWQIQKQGEVTIQGELNRCLSSLCRGEEVKTIGSGRTDAGVHALAQVVRMELPIEIPLEGLLKGLNSTLPKDIRVFDIEESTIDFHPIHSAEKKQYRYFFCPFGKTNPLTRYRYAESPPKINFELIPDCLKIFLGEHNFKDFQTVGTPVDSTIRKIFKAKYQVREKDEWFPKRHEIILEGNGFLKQMVRLMIGTVWENARGKVSLDQIKESLEKGSSGHLAPVAPSSGLYLWEVFYS